MNLFQKYGIKEVADVVFYSINEIGDEEFYTPVLYLDTLKVSTLEKTSEKVFAQGGYGNKRLIGWNFGKEITLTLEDALFSPASMSLMWGGRLNSKLSDYTGAIVKCNLANKYAELHYSTKAYPSPALTDEEWEKIFVEILYDMANGFLLGTYQMKFDELTKTYSDPIPYNEEEDFIINNMEDIALEAYNFKYKKDYNQSLSTYITKVNKYISMIVNNENYEYFAENKSITYTTLFGVSTCNLNTFMDERFPRTDTTIQHYFKRDRKYNNNIPYAMNKEIIERLKQKIAKISDVGYIDTKREDTEVIDRMEKCIVTKKEGFVISTQQQKKNLFRYYANDDSSSYTIYYDAKTMLPLFQIQNDTIIGWNEEDTNKSSFKLKLGTIYYKWTRTVKRKEAEDDGILGRQLIIDAETFPDSYRIVGETYIREQKTGKDQRYQFTIFKANVSADTNVTLQADGDPTTFSMSIDVLTPPNDIMMELKEYDVEEDLLEGGTRIIPQKSTYTYTPAMNEELIADVDDNNEIY